MEGLIHGGGLFSEFYGILSDDYDDMIYTLTLLQTKKCHFPHPFSDQISKINTHSRTWPNLACSRLSDSCGDSPVFSRFMFVFALSQFSGPSNLGAWNRLGLIRQKICHHYQVRAETKNYPNAFRIRTFLFRSYSMIWN